MGTTSACATFMAAAVIGDPQTLFNALNARIGVGDGVAAFNPAHVDLQGTQKFRKGMDAAYPQRLVSTITFRATFGTGEANFPWQEWGIFNAASGGTMLNRKIESLGTKGGGQSWQLTAAINFTEVL